MYWSFISHSAVDAAAAEKLKVLLESRRLPASLRKQHALPARLVPIYLDRHEAGPSVDLGHHLRSAIASSKTLIVLCSPEAARSRWVNAEIEHFLTTSERSAVCLFALRGSFEAEPGSPQCCLPPACHGWVRLHEDGHPDDDSITYLNFQQFDGDITKAVVPLLAHIARVNYGEVRRAITASMRRRDFGLGATAALAGLAGYAAFDHLREKTEFFHSYVTRWHVPHGLHPVPLTERGRHPTQYRIVSSGGLVRSLSFVSSWGRLVPGGFSFDSSKILFKYDEKGRLMEQRCFNANDVEVAVLRFNEDLKHASKVATQHAGPAGGSVSMSPQSQYYRTTPLPGDQLLWQFGKTAGCLYTYDFTDTGLLARSATLSLEGLPFTDENGVHASTFEYDAQNRMVAVSHVDAAGKPAEDYSGVHRTRYEIDSLGRATAQWYEDVSGKRTRCEFGFSKQTFTFEPPTGPYQKLSNAYLDEEDRLMTIRKGFARYDTLVDEAGNFVAFHYRDKNGMPVRSENGYASMQISYNERGEAVKTLFLDANGKSCVNLDGDCGYLKEYDSHGNVTHSVPLLLKDAAISEGGRAIRSSYDEAGRLRHQEWHDAQGKTMPGPRGFHAENRFYDANGNLRRKEFRDEKGALTAAPKTYEDNESGAAAVEFSYNGYGTLTAMKFLGTDNQPTFNPYEAAEMRFEYAPSGNLSGVRFFGVKGQPVTNSLGFHKIGWQEAFDDRRLEASFFDVSLKPVDVEKSNWPFGNMGHAAFLPPRFHRWITTHTKDSARLSFFLADGKNTAEDWEYSAVEFQREQDDYWNIIRFFDAQGKLREITPQMKVVFDAIGRVVSVTYLNAGGEIQEDGRGVATVEVDYDTDPPEQRWKNRQGQEVIPGVMIETVATQTDAAAQLGLLPGDVLLRIGGWDLYSTGDYKEPDTLLEKVQAAITTEAAAPKEVIIAREGKLMKPGAAKFVKLGAYLAGTTLPKALAELAKSQ